MLLSVSENGTSIEIGGKEVSLLPDQVRKMNFYECLNLISYNTCVYFITT